MRMAISNELLVVARVIDVLIERYKSGQQQKDVDGILKEVGREVGFQERNAKKRISEYFSRVDSDIEKIPIAASGRTKKVRRLKDLYDAFKDPRRDEFETVRRDLEPLISRVRLIHELTRSASLVYNELPLARRGRAVPTVTMGTTLLVSARFIPRVLRKLPNWAQKGVRLTPCIDEPHRLIRPINQTPYDIVVTYCRPDDVPKAVPKEDQVDLVRCVIGPPDQIYDWIAENTAKFTTDILKGKDVAVFKDIELAMPGIPWKALQLAGCRLTRLQSSLEVHAYARCFWHGVTHLPLLNELGQEEIGFLAADPETDAKSFGRTVLYMAVKQDKQKEEHIKEICEAIRNEFSEMKRNYERAKSITQSLDKMTCFYQSVLFSSAPDGSPQKDVRWDHGTLALRITPNLIVQGRLTLDLHGVKKNFHVGGRVEIDENDRGCITFRASDHRHHNSATAFCRFEYHSMKLYTCPKIANTLIGHWHGCGSNQKAGRHQQSADNSKSLDLETIGVWILTERQLKPDEIRTIVNKYCLFSGLPLPMKPFDHSGANQPSQSPKTKEVPRTKRIHTPLRRGLSRVS